MESRCRALIVGGSMSGLLTGIMLDRRGWTVDIFERVGSELAGRGAGIVAQAELIARLDALGLDTRDLGVAMTTRKILDRAGRVTAAIECPQVLTAWERVYRLLRDAFSPRHYHRGVGLKAFEQCGEGIVAHLTDGSAVEAEVLIGADGLRSTVRQQCLPDVMPLYAGYVAWRALLAEGAIPPAIHREQFEQMVFCLPPGEQCLGYPVAGPNNELRVGQRRYNVVWYRPADEAKELPWLLTDEAGVTHSISIPPPLIRREPIAAMRAAGTTSSFSASSLWSFRSYFFPPTASTPRCCSRSRPSASVFSCARSAACCSASMPIAGDEKRRCC
jgi:2-polyprenyl-6-methoxyphenol hydroxylase-like FAD-dependent oxidoreductase